MTSHLPAPARVADNSTETAPEKPPSGRTLFALLNSVLRNRWLVALTTTVVVIFIVTRTLLKERTWSSTATFIPTSNRPSSMAAGLAAQFGIVMPTSSDGESPDFYVDLIESRELLHRVVDAKYKVPYRGAERSGTLADIYDVGPGTPRDRHEAALGELNSSIDASVQVSTGTVQVVVKSNSAELSQAINLELLRQIEAFNKERRRTRARAEREFTEQRLAESAAELRAAEDRVRQFLESNRNSSSPTLLLSRERLQRDVLMRQEIYTALAKAHEQSKIEEVRDNPVITVVEHPELAYRPDPRYLTRNGLFSVVLGIALGIVLALLRDALRRERAADPEDFGELRRLWGQTLDDLKQPSRIFTGTRPSGRS